jgi:hypothetical protein
MSDQKLKRKTSVSGRYCPDGAVRYRYDALQAEWAIFGRGADATLITYHGRRQRFDFYRSYRSDFALEADLSRSGKKRRAWRKRSTAWPPGAFSITLGATIKRTYSSIKYWKFVAKRFRWWKSRASRSKSHVIFRNAWFRI